MKTQGKHSNVVFLSGVRTGFGSFGGSLKEFSATDLGVVAGKQALDRSGVEPSQVQHVIFGNAQQILLGESSVVLAGGAESMSQAPHVVRGARWGIRLGPGQALEDSLWEAL